MSSVKVTNKIPNKIKVAFKKAISARKQAYAPYSGFKVGAVIVDENGKFIPGYNVENASYGATVCAERVALFSRAKEAGKVKVDHVVVVTDCAKPVPPCGMCLQVMAEFCHRDTQVWLGNLEGIKSVYKLKSLLPKPFGPEQLNQ